MVVVIIILAVLLLGASAFIFWLMQVLKNTFNITEKFLYFSNIRWTTKRRIYFVIHIHIWIIKIFEFRVVIHNFLLDL